MSGFVGILNLNGRPVDPAVLDCMTRAMTLRGPDGLRSCVEQEVGLGCALLRTTNGSSVEHQPFTLDSQTWVVGDARLDGRSDLIKQLEGLGHIAFNFAAPTDIELVLRAYHQWGESCVEHLIGDFSFAVWDKAIRQLFCARDHIGVKPFFYAQVKGTFVFGNTLNTLRLHPEISDELNPTAIGDFLLFAMLQDRDASFYRDLLRLPPSHTLRVSSGKLLLKKYWTLTPLPELRYKDSHDYVDHFRELLKVAVADRLRTERVSVLMSGGLDSSSLAATSRDLLREQGRAADLKAFCVTCSSLFDDPEEHYSSVAAHALGIPLELIRMDKEPLYSAWDHPLFNTPEPVLDPLFGNPGQLYRSLIAHGRVGLTGYDGDTVLECDYGAHLWSRLKPRRLGCLLKDCVSYAMHARSIPPLGFRRLLKRWREQGNEFADYPPWLNPEFERRWNLRDRWREAGRSREPEDVHPGICRIFDNPMWPALLESFDAGMTMQPLEFRHPLVDIRMLNFLLRLPPLPWCPQKRIIRIAMQSILPEAILSRPKTPLRGNPVLVLYKLHGLKYTPSSSHVGQYVRLESIPRHSSGYVQCDTAWINLRPISLSLWLSRYTQTTQSARPV